MKMCAPPAGRDNNALYTCGRKVSAIFPQKATQRRPPVTSGPHRHPAPGATRTAHVTPARLPASAASNGHHDHRITVRGNTVSFCTCEAAHPTPPFCPAGRPRPKSRHAAAAAPTMSSTTRTSTSVKARKPRFSLSNGGVPPSPRQGSAVSPFLRQMPGKGRKALQTPSSCAFRTIGARPCPPGRCSLN